MKKERNPNKVFNRKIKGKCPRGRYISRWKKCRRKEEHERNLRRGSFGNIQTDGQTWLLEDPHKKKLRGL
jgi:hypothetical protein